MRYSLFLLLVVLIGAGQTARAQTAPTPGSCTLGVAESDLDINNVFGRVFNTGSLFFGNTTTAGNGYLVPKESGHSPIFASGLWVAGRVGGELRMAAATYSGFNFWPGPLGTDGRPVNPTNCSQYDRIWNVTRNQILAFEGGGAPATDLAEWPAELGAPVIDGDGNPNNYDLGAGDRPDIIGDQGLWWVMNDVGGAHTANATPVLGIEVQVLAWAFSRSDAIGNTTFYRYRVINKSGVDITETYLSLFSDPDLGDAVDDYVGSDPESGLGFTYNADNADAVYGVPPAMGYDFFQGPIVPDGPDEGTDVDTLGTSSFMYFSNVPGTPTSDPSTGEARYFFMQGRWGDGSEMRDRGDGFEETGGNLTTFAFPGNPVNSSAWSELNPGAGLPPNPPNDRRFLITTGPFTLENGVPQDIVFGIIFAQGTSNLNSITELRAADLLAQTAYDAGFQLPAPPPAPERCTDETSSTPQTSDDFGSGQCLEAISQNGQVTLVWGYGPSNPNYLGQYEVFDVFLTGQGAVDSTYNFEGFRIYRYPTNGFASDQRELVADLDIVNGIGADTGLSYSFNIDNLTNYQDYFYAVSAYAYNEESLPQINESQPTVITVRPAGLTSGVETQSAFGDSLAVAATTQRGEGSVNVRIVDPTRITGDTYEVRFFTPTNADGTPAAGITTYSIVNTTTGQTVLDGQAYFAQTGQAFPQGNNVAVIDGFSFDIQGPAPGYKTFLVTQNAAGPLDPPEYAAACGASFGVAEFPFVPGQTSVDCTPQDRQQVGPAEWMIHQGSLPLDSSFPTFFERTTRAGANLGAIGANDYEWRFTGSSIALRAFTDNGAVTVPFELWDIGTTPDDASDDVRLIPLMNPSGTPDAFDLGNTDHAVSGGTNDPFTDWIYWYRPLDASPGQAGYLAYANNGTPNGDLADQEIFARMVLVNWNGGPVATGVYNQPLPEQGTVFRIVTFKPNQPGDVFTFSTAGLQATTPTAEQQEAALDRIAAVPNPYMGTSSYETGNLSRVIRFTNLPEQAVTIRIFTVSGSLVQTLSKEGSSRSLDWNMETSNNLPVASGMYLVHVDVEGVGERTLKLGVINRRTQITVF